MKYIIVCTDYDDIKATFTEMDGNNHRDYGCGARAYCGTASEVIDPVYGTYTKFTRNTGSDCRHSAAVVEAPEDNVWPANCTKYDYDAAGLAKAQSDHPDIYWDMLGEFWGNAL